MKILIIQTAFIGDVILATALVEKLGHAVPGAQVDMLVRKGNETLLHNNPIISHCWVWNKKRQKYRSLVKIIRSLRQHHYDEIINVQRFMASGLITVLAGAKHTTGYKKNPLSRFFTLAVPHSLGDGLHETERNQQLINHLTEDKQPAMPRLYPSELDFYQVKKYKSQDYITVSAASVWFTKQFPPEQWTALMDILTKHDMPVYFIGSKADADISNRIIDDSKNEKLYNLCGKLSFLESAALMKDANMNYTNDSAPLHIASAMNANTTAVFCSTIPEFGFGPLANNSRVAQIEYDLSCRPCGVHGYRTCPKKHFRCAYDIDIEKLVSQCKKI
jgi:heptosyltransferase-2